MAKKIIVPIEVETKTAKKNVDELNKSIATTGKEAKKASEGAKDSANSLSSMGAAGGRLAPIVGIIKKINLGFKSMKVAIAATGIGLLLIAFASLKAAFTSTEAGQNKFNKSVIVAFIDVMTVQTIKLVEVKPRSRFANAVQIEPLDRLFLADNFIIAM